MTYEKTSHGYIIRMIRGERAMQLLTQFCRTNQVPSGSFTGIGACSHAEIGFYDLAKKEYSFTPYDEDMEVVALSGNIAALHREPFLHAHAVLSDRNMRTYGGHCKELVVAATLEIYLTDADIAIERAHDEEIGLNLLNLDTKYQPE